MAQHVLNARVTGLALYVTSSSQPWPAQQALPPPPLVADSYRVDTTNSNNEVVISSCSSTSSSKHNSFTATTAAPKGAAASSDNGSNVSDAASGPSTSTAAYLNTVSRLSSRPQSSVDAREAAKFAALAESWWDSTSGPFAPLHALNAARCSFIRQGICSIRGLQQHDAEPLAGLTALDVGCGGGLLSEPLARMGAEVTGIDVSDEGVAAAAAHAAADPQLAERIRYQKSMLEEIVASGARFDLVLASEVVEHVRRPQQFIADLGAVTRPGGQVIITTLNRTPASYALAIVGAEYLLGFVPQGTHKWTKFLTPQEVAMMAQDAGLTVKLMAGMGLDMRTGQFTLGDDMSVNYAAMLSKPVTASLATG
eukprot:GHRR01018952.1.p1 GENE.GHRR01018952.1~~GHRR01018952.1.p1  ORF type:complete len:367 (+),score=110.33 GHRR01018952.1:130-1230(+)